MSFILADLFVQDVDKAIQFYCDVLGFTFRDKAAEPGEAPFWGWVSLGDCSIMFSSRESAYKGEYAKNLDFRQGLENNQWGVGVTICFRHAVPDLDAYYEQVKARGAKITMKLETAPYGWRHFKVSDRDGYCLDFSIDA
ncbi:MAG TPA: VOC family protein [Symbiobacteriaceae bacterium]|nr:VOC family protein [Symbiobacteriaceae bacterium]